MLRVDGMPSTEDENGSLTPSKSQHINEWVKIQLHCNSTEKLTLFS